MFLNLLNLAFPIHLALAQPGTREPLVRAAAVTKCGDFFRTSIPIERLVQLEYLSRPAGPYAGDVARRFPKMLNSILSHRIELEAEDGADMISLRVDHNSVPILKVSRGSKVLGRIKLVFNRDSALGAHLKVSRTTDAYVVQLRGTETMTRARVRVVFTFTRSAFLRRIDLSFRSGSVARDGSYRPVGVESDRALGFVVVPGYEQSSQLLLQREDVAL